MSGKADKVAAAARKSSREIWLDDYAGHVSGDDRLANRSGITINPLYTPQDWNDGQYDADLSYPGQPPFTRGIYASMHRGRTWSQRQLIGLGTPADYNRRVLRILDAGADAISLIPCNSVFRGIDCDEVPVPLLGTCGTVINNVDHMSASLDKIPYDKISTALNDPSPFTLLAFLLADARRKNIPWEKIRGTSNQSDYISHCVANHMFFRLSLAGARRVLLDHIAFCSKKVPNWNPVSVVGQHMQQAGATPAEAMAFTLSTAVQYANDCQEKGMELDDLLPRFTFFFDISISFFEEIAKFRAGRRVWARLTRERLKSNNPRSQRFKFHGQTSGADLTVQQPLNNIARVTTQAMAGILSGLQSMHTDSFDEAIACPSKEGARIAIATQNILKDEAHLCDVIDPLGGSYYIETLTNQMEEAIEAVIADIDAQGGMYQAVVNGYVQRRIGQSALCYQGEVDSGAQKVIGVNSGLLDDDDSDSITTTRPDRMVMEQHVSAFRKFKEERSQASVRRSLDDLAAAARSPDRNVFAQVVESAAAGVTHGEIVACLRNVLGAEDQVIVE